MQNSTGLEKAISDAIASMKIEGFTYTDEERTLLTDFVLGKISKEALVLQITSKKISLERSESNEC